MRRGGRLPFVVMMMILVIAVAAPLATLTWHIATDFTSAGSGEPPRPMIRDSATLLRSTAGWAASVALGAMLVGWLPGRFLAQRLSHRGEPGNRGFVAAAALCMVPIFLPAYLMFWCWWQTWPVDSWLFRVAVEHRIMGTVRGVTLWLALVLWSWPICAWCAAGAIARRSRDEEDLSRIDGMPWPLRLLSQWRLARSGLLLGGVIVFVFIFNNVTAFDLAQVHTLGFELRAVLAEGGSPRDLLHAGRWGVMLAAAVVVISAIMLRGIGRHTVDESLAPPRPSRVLFIPTGVIWIASIAIPIIFILIQPFDARAYELVISGYSRAALHTVLTAAAAGAMGVVLTASTGLAWSTGGRWMRGLITTSALLWAFAAALPAPVVSTAIELLLNRPGLAEIAYRTPVAMVCGYMARFGFVAVLIGLWVAASESRELRAARELDGATGLVGQWQAGRPRWLAGVAASFGIVAVLSLSEVLVTAQLQPPGFEALAGILLSNMHYQRDGLVVLAALAQFVVALGAGLLMALAVATLRRTRPAVPKRA